MLLVGKEQWKQQKAGMEAAKPSGIFALILQTWEQTHFCWYACYL